MLDDSPLVRAARAAAGEIWRRRGPIHDRRQLSIEPLEHRLLLANILGTDKPDTITVSAYADQIHVKVNDTPEQVITELIIAIYALDGNDTVMLGQIGDNTGSKFHIFIDLGNGDDYAGVDSPSLDASGDGMVTLAGNAGNDTLDVDASSSTRIRTFDFRQDAAHTFQGYLQAGPPHDGGLFYYDYSLEDIALDGSEQDDVFSLDYKRVETHLTVNGRGGDDDFFVGAYSFSTGGATEFSDPAAGWLTGTTTLSGGVGNDSAVYDDKYAAVDPAGYALSSSNISKGSAAINFVTLESQTLNAADGNVININGTNPFTSMTVNASNCTINLNSLISPTTVNGSDCTVNAGNGNLDNIEAPVTLNMSTASNTDLLNINDQGATTDATYIFGPGSFTARNSANPINFTGLDQIIFHAGSGNDLIAVEQLAPNEPLAAFGNGGNDTLTLSQGDVHDSILSPVSFDGGPGTDTFFIENALAASSGVLTATGYTEAGITHTYVNCELLQFVGGVLDPTNLDIASLSIPATIRGGSAADTYRVGGGNLDGLTGQINIDGKGGNDSLLVDDRFAFTGDGYTISSGLVSTHTSFIETANIESETIQGSDHDDTFDIRSSVPDLNVLGNGGDDLIFSESGTANIDTGSETPNTTGDSVLVNFGGSGSTLRLLKNDRIGDIDIYSGGVLGVPAGITLDVSTLNAYAGSVLDMNGAMIARNASAALDQFGARLGAGYNSGAWDGTSGAAPTINSSLAHSSSIKDSVGYALARNLLNIAGSQTGSWQGQTINPGDVLVKYTYAGDANLDGRINIDDYGRIDSNVGRSGTVFGWYNGDFNFDAKINIDDYGIIDSNIGAQGSPLVGSAAHAGSFDPLDGLTGRTEVA